MGTARGLRWYLFGAQAGALYGVVRTSADVDVTVELPASDVATFVAEMRAAGFTPRVPDVAGFVASTRVLPFAHDATSWPVDVVLAGPGIEETFLAGVRRIDVQGTAVPVIAPEDLIVTKVLAGRPKDLEDIRGILRQGSVIIAPARVLTLLRALEAALGQSDLIPLFERLVAEAARR